MVNQGAGAAGPLLLASRQCDPHRLAQRLPSHRGWCVVLCATTTFAGALPCSCLRSARCRSGKEGRCLFSFPALLVPPYLALHALLLAGGRARVSLSFACSYAIP